MLFGRRQRSIEKLLVVEDEPLVAFDTEYLLSDNGFTVVATVDRVADAVRLIEGGVAIDLILVDVNLADGSGIDVARAAATRGMPVLFVTGACPVEAETVAIGCLTKPYTQRDLLGSIGAIEMQVEGKPPPRVPGGLRLFGAGPAATGLT
ncbi:DNA-binding response OmpR family regulator [Sphingomonas sp. BE138]|uniref:response regulator n=1 Tax=Sphingomonas sp. BE138 TaxID=2817845 RepID=UPI002859D8C0|nr:response regulator [Sphingomonas sp. BE138]MDR6789511.1 DNA-binding response OmpR family regulator [Sphingomonas sp. BE138]